MLLDPKSPRPVCKQCLRSPNACICRWVTPVVHVTEVLILQHPLEVLHPKNSGRLLHLSLANSRLLVGESLPADAWDLALEATKYTMLLYPPATTTETMPTPTPAPLQMQDPAHLRLVVIDATWRKSRKMLHLNPVLQQLPRLALDTAPSSRYRIRKAHKPGQLSTLEATCAALMQLGGDVAAFESLLNAFDGFVEQQARFSHPQLQRSQETVPR